MILCFYNSMILCFYIIPCFYASLLLCSSASLPSPHPSLAPFALLTPSAATEHLGPGCGREEAGAGTTLGVQLELEAVCLSLSEMCGEITSPFPVETSSSHPSPAFQLGDNLLLSVLIAPCWIQEVLWIVQQAYCH